MLNFFVKLLKPFDANSMNYVPQSILLRVEWGPLCHRTSLSAYRAAFHMQYCQQMLQKSVPFPFCPPTIYKKLVFVTKVHLFVCKDLFSIIIMELNKIFKFLLKKA